MKKRIFSFFLVFCMALSLIPAALAEENAADTGTETRKMEISDILPWVTCLFVTEEYRGRGICGELIARANSYAKTLGYDRTYIPSPHLGLYERYGYRYVRDIVNYGGESDHLFVKEI